MNFEKIRNANQKKKKTSFAVHNSFHNWTHKDTMHALLIGFLENKIKIKGNLATCITTNCIFGDENFLRLTFQR